MLLIYTIYRQPSLLIKYTSTHLTSPQPPKEEKKTIHTCMSIGILLTPSFDVYSWVY